MGCGIHPGFIIEAYPQLLKRYKNSQAAKVGMSYTFGHKSNFFAWWKILAKLKILVERTQNFRPPSWILAAILDFDIRE